MRALISALLCLYATAAFAEIDANWDWFDDTTYFDYYGNEINSPWGFEDHIGLNLMFDKPERTEGWRLYTRRFTCSDYKDECSDSTVSIQYKYPRFVLYNIYTGTLRTFIFLNDQNYDGDKQLYAKFEIPYTTRGLLLHEGDVSTTLDAAAENQNANVGHAITVPSYYQRWLVFDKELSYDPTVVEPDLVFMVQVGAYQESIISLGGEFDFTFADEQSISDPSHSLMDTAIYAGKTLAKRSDDVHDLAGNLETHGNRLSQNNDERLRLVGEEMLTLSSFLYGNPGGYIALAAGAADIYNSLTTKDGSNISTMYGSGSITLDGDIVNQYPLEFIAFGVHGSEQTYPQNEVELQYDGALGLFSIAHKPKFEVGKDYVKLASDIRSLVNINPDSYMRLVDIKVSPRFKTQGPRYDYRDASGSLEMDVWYTEVISGALLPFYNGRYWETHETHSARKATRGSTSEIFSTWQRTPDFINPDDVYSTWEVYGCDRWPDWTIAVDEYGVARSVWQSEDCTEPAVASLGFDSLTIDEAQLKIYLRFEHIADPSITAEYVRTYNADIIRTDCAKLDRTIQLKNYPRCAEEPSTGEMPWLVPIITNILM